MYQNMSSTPHSTTGGPVSSKFESDSYSKLSSASPTAKKEQTYINISSDHQQDSDHKEKPHGHAKSSAVQSHDPTETTAKPERDELSKRETNNENSRGERITTEREDQGNGARGVETVTENSKQTSKVVAAMTSLSVDVADDVVRFEEMAVETVEVQTSDGNKPHTQPDGVNELFKTGMSQGSTEGSQGMRSQSLDAADVMTTAVWGVTEGSVMTQPHTSLSSPLKSDHRNSRDNTTPPDALSTSSGTNSMEPQLPDILASRPTPASLLNRPQGFYCYSTASKNYSEICSSPDDCDCPKRSAFIFTELVADVGGCLCTRKSARVEEPAMVSDLPLALPDLISAHHELVSKKKQKHRMAQKTVLVTGGAGYIGSHVIIELIQDGFDIVVLDNLVNASMESIRRVEKIAGKKIPTYSVDLLDKNAVDDVFKKHKISSVIHLAGLKAVGESCELPLLYYKTNVGGTTNLLEVMEANGVFNIVFSSSATVYGLPQFLPLTEDHPVGGCTNPYGKTKFMIEQILSDLCTSNKKWNVAVLRYFNPVGAHKSGTIGEDPSGVPNNLMPFMGQVAVGRRASLTVYGSDYDTPDGTGVRDYIHVVDLALGHVAAVHKLNEQCGLKVYNLGTGQGVSVLDMVKAFEKASGKKIPYELAERRLGDIASCYGDPSLAAKELNWTATRGLDEMCEDLWRWQSQNPQGYKGAEGSSQ
ncbi:hypothetical protein V1264_023690 [Littorina saxatilis]|uniref:UDP-N-acetylglucosamine 4-epimerase n=2 Tax=Littorina saxatilis TaxID=31220 RepID=A0AAN9B8Q0_9CAEN